MRLFAAIGRLGETPTEQEGARLDRQVIVFGGLLMSIGGAIWGLLAIHVGLFAAACIPFGYGLATAFNLGRFARTRRVGPARVIQVALSLFLPFLFQWALGGFVQSGASMLWAMIALVGSLTFSNRREAASWLVLYCVLTLSSGLMDPHLARASEFHPSNEVVLLFFVINVVLISAIVFGLALLMTTRQRIAIAEANESRRQSQRLSTQLNQSLQDRERDVERLVLIETELVNLTMTLESRVAEKTAELSSAVKQAELATRVKGDFLATMSHEIRTPLNGILATADLLHTSELCADQADSVRLIRRSGEHLLAILNDVLDFSKIEAGKLELLPRAFDLREEITTLVGLHRASLAERDLAIEARLPDNLPAWLEGDPDRLRQVLGNLLSNAIKFTERGHITLSVVFGREGDQSRLHFSVSDTGIGMASGTIERLFEPFTQADSSHSRRFGGTGLGLSICARLVRLMGGALVATSRLGKGSTFAFELSMPISRPPLATTGANAPTSDHHSPHVLLVEDNAINQVIARKLLDRLRCQVTLAQDGEEAVAAVTSQTFDLVLMDLQMPRLDGFQATRAIRALPLPAQPWIVAVTANAFDSDRQQCFEAGMNEFMGKPLRLDELRKLIDRFSSPKRSVA